MADWLFLVTLGTSDTVPLKVTVYQFNDIHDQISKLHFQGK